MSKKYISFIGTGAWASALANLLAQNGHSVKMYGINNEEINEINQGYNRKFFGSRSFANKDLIQASNDLSFVLKDCQTLVIAIPSVAIRSALKQISALLKKRKVNIINVSKGFDDQTGDFLSDLIKTKLKRNIKYFATFAGPSYATEVFNEHLTLINVFASDQEFEHELISKFNNNYFKLVPCQDEYAGEIFAALKNVLAIGIGISAFTHLGKNPHSALISVGTKEILSVIKQIKPNSNPNIGFELVGIGDIFLTCSSTQSRNFTFGYAVAENGLKEALKMQRVTVEGFSSAKALSKIIQANNIKNIPLLESIIAVLNGSKEPILLTDFLINEY
ncbi:MULTISPECIES: NAD(P)H-dependent glycerol-3-phosphate dehydrogenase [unclassified Mycoplasma]|uniref:NAD(P)H-dependent glycerol-3-phosphate dehydrogenase n=1 Tax=unclassified Mycoplasma TaxID=2683645 RepID=UPI00211C2EB4|nr:MULTISPECIES: NAD(P)H-dependent glycerol-3-phosphate dehydrogenase [unclassified Mycoplasma]UUM19652.1 NAD(P)-binding domain-containing protein [Mycoplasma sp. 1578d]UUM24621.1 NAD(P)-binding domain-containing protein [Mycoplasma sp. 3686d]